MSNILVTLRYTSGEVAQFEASEWIVDAVGPDYATESGMIVTNAPTVEGYFIDHADVLGLVRCYAFEDWQARLT